MDEIVLDGKKYRLVPADEEKPQKVQSKSVLDDYVGWKKPVEPKIEPQEQKSIKAVTERKKASGVIKRAKPKLYDYRERYKKREVRWDDVNAKQSRLIKSQDNPDPTGRINRQAGYDVWVGEGTVIDF